MIGEDEKITLLIGIDELLQEHDIATDLDFDESIVGGTIYVLLDKPKVVHLNRYERVTQTKFGQIYYMDHRLWFATEDIRAQSRTWHIEDPDFRFEDVVEYVVHGIRSSVEQVIRRRLNS